MSDRAHVRNESVANYEVPATGAEATCLDDGPGAQILRFIDDDGRLKFVKDDQYVLADHDQSCSTSACVTLSSNAATKLGA